jgi:hypothetical protein
MRQALVVNGSKVASGTWMAREQGVGLWCVVLAAWALALAWPRAASAGPTLSWSAPASAVGDGKTAVVLALTVSPPDAVALTSLEVAASAGKVARGRAAGPGRYEFDFIPPRVVEKTRVTIEGSVRGGPPAPPASIDVMPSLGKPVERTSSGPLALRVPERLILGHDQSATISVREVENARITLAVSVGSVTRLEEGQQGRLVATYRPPAEKFPQLVIVVATSDDGVLADWSVIRLYGRPLVNTTSEPNASVRIRVSGVEYGPVRSDQHGKARLRVLAPPGVNQAYALASDRAGNERMLPLRLGVPDFRRTFAVCPAYSGALLFFAVDPTGQPRQRLQLQTSASLGQLGEPRPLPASYYRAELSLPDEVPSGQALELSAQVVGEQESTATCQTQVPGESPNDIALVLSRPSYRAGSGQRVRVQVQLKYAGKRRPRRIPLRVRVDFGAVTGLRELSAGRYEASWSVPDQLGNRSRATVRVRTAVSPLLQAEQVLELEPGPVARLDLEADRTRLWADGQSQCSIVAHVRDAAGNGVTGVGFTAHAAGQLDRFVPQAPGVYTARYVAPVSSGGTDLVTVRDSQGRAQAQLAISLIPGRRVLGWLRGGYLTNFGRVSGPVVWGGAGLRLPEVEENAVVGGEVGYYASRSADRDAAGLEDVTVAVTVMPLCLRAVYEFPLAPVVPYLGVGTGLSFAWTEVSSDSSGTTKDFEVLWAVSARAGAAAAVGPGRLAAELGYLHSDVDEPVLEGNIGGAEFTAGYQLGF